MGNFFPRHAWTPPPQTPANNFSAYANPSGPNKLRVRIKPGGGGLGFSNWSSDGGQDTSTLRLITPRPDGTFIMSSAAFSPVPGTEYAAEGSVSGTVVRLRDDRSLQLMPSSMSLLVMSVIPTALSYPMGPPGLGEPPTMLIFNSDAVQAAFDPIPPAHWPPGMRPPPNHWLGQWFRPLPLNRIPPGEYLQDAPIGAFAGSQSAPPPYYAPPPYLPPYPYPPPYPSPSPYPSPYPAYAPPPAPSSAATVTVSPAASAAVSVKKL